MLWEIGLHRIIKQPERRVEPALGSARCMFAYPALHAGLLKFNHSVVGRINKLLPYFKNISVAPYPYLAWYWFTK